MIRAAYIALICAVMLVFAGSSALAISDEFIIGVTIGSDSNPPTIPAPILATPVSSSQIDIVWGASVDDQSLSGYQLFRDAVQIATTTLLTYSDTGLVASTTYTYTVQAYDWMMNVSTTSASAATTTLQTPVAATTTEPSHEGRLRVRLTNLDIEPSQNTAEIAWSTNTYAKYTLRWGKLSVYGIGFVQTEVFKKNHHTVISDLEPGTKYVYELIGYDRSGDEYVLSRDSFTTQSAPDNSAPTNVANLRAVVEGDSVRLFWNNPDYIDLTKVRIIRNYNFYPSDTSNGFIAYEGDKETFFDRDALLLYNDQYYTIFSYDVYGNISSGAVVSVHKIQNTQEDRDVGNGANEEISKENDGIASTTVRTDGADKMQIGFLEVDILQNNIEIVPVDDVVHITDHVPVIFQIPYNRLPEHLKTIIMTVDAETNQSASYMLRINTIKSVYQAVLPRFTVLGEHTLSFEIYDYQTQKMTSFEGYIQVEPSFNTTSVTHKIWQQDIQSYIARAGSFFIFIILLFMVYIGFVRKSTKE